MRFKVLQGVGLLARRHEEDSKPSRPEQASNSGASIPRTAAPGPASPVRAPPGHTAVSPAWGGAGKPRELAWCGGLRTTPSAPSAEVVNSVERERGAHRPSASGLRPVRNASTPARDPRSLMRTRGHPEMEALLTA